MKLLSYKFVLKNLLGLLLVLGLYPMMMIVFMEHGFFEGLQWGLWLLFYFFLTTTFIFYVVTKVFFTKPEKLYHILYLNLFIALSVVLKIIPLPLGMSLAFVVPILTAALIHPFWGALVGFFMVMVSSLISGSIGPWTPIQLYLLVIVPAVMIWFPQRLRSNKLFIMTYGLVWGVIFGLMMSLYFWPILSKPMDGDSQWSSFIVFYSSTSLAWDVFRALGNFVFLGLLFTPFKKAISGCMGLDQLVRDL